MNVVKFKKNNDLLNETLNSVFGNRLFADWENLNLTKSYTPKVNITEDRDIFNIKMELPGLTREDVKLAVENNVLSVSGSKKEETKTEEKNVIVNELFYGEFSRNFNLSKDIKIDAIDAEFKDGILNITLPKVEEAKPVVKEINIK
ncbi:MAG TPA: Hsp20/alpha crystallin family protein [Ignavibacteria bacterium]|nr:Hsp20/alpha crystallin family protein [Ignavibacteria bacterium]